MTTLLMNGVNTNSVVYSDSMVIVHRGDWLEHLSLPFMARTVIERLPQAYRPGIHIVAKATPASPPQDESRVLLRLDGLVSFDAAQAEAKAMLEQWFMSGL